MAYTALYNLYRPHTFSEVIGQQAVVKTLQNQVHSKMISHAYLFSGPRGIGKTSMARIFARAINCISPVNGEACGKCTTCEALTAKNNLDIIEIDAASNTGVNDIRTLRENVKYMPVAGKYRIYIIDEVHMLSVNAFNALLKTLEEPPEHIVFIMATTEPHKLPVTVLSRCQRFEFTRISTQLITKHLEDLVDKLGVQADPQALVAIARSAAGGMRDAMSLLDQILAMGENKIDAKQVSDMLGSADKLLYFALCEAVLKEDISRSLMGLNRMLEKGCSASTISSDMMQMFRDLYIAQSSKNIMEDLMVDDTTAGRYKRLSSMVSAGSLLKCLEIFSTLENDLRYATRPEIWLELAVAKSCRVQKDESYEALLSRVERLEKMLENGIQINAKKPANAVAAQDVDEQEEFFPIKDDDFVPHEAYNMVQDLAPPPEFDGEHDFGMPQEPIIRKAPVQPKREPVINIPQKSKPVVDDAPEQSKQPNQDVVVAGDGDVDEGRSIWNAAVNEVRNQKIMRLFTAMKKAKVTSFDGTTLKVEFGPDDEASAKRLDNNELKNKLKKTLKKISSRDIIVEAKLKQLSEEENSFMQKLYDKFPKDLVSQEYDE